MRNRVMLLVLGGTAVLVSLMPWFSVGGPLPPIIWVLRIGLPLLGVGMIAFAIWYGRRKDRAPDILATMFKSRCECAGLCFATEPQVRQGVAYLDLYYQNRYAQPCVMTITMTVHGMMASMPLLHARIECEGGAFGVYRIPMAVPKKLQGRRKSVSIDAKNTYPLGRGELLRVHGGSLVGALPPGLTIAASVLGAFGGVYGVLAQADGNVRIPLADDVADELPDDLKPEHEVLWLPGDDVIDLSDAREDTTLQEESAVIEPAALPA